MGALTGPWGCASSSITQTDQENQKGRVPKIFKEVAQLAHPSHFSLCPHGASTKLNTQTKEVMKGIYLPPGPKREVIPIPVSSITAHHGLPGTQCSGTKLWVSPKPPGQHRAAGRSGAKHWSTLRMGIFHPQAEKQSKTHTNASNQKQTVMGKLAVWVSFPSNRHQCLR